MELEFRLTMPPTKLGTNHRRRLHWSVINDLTERSKVLYQAEVREQCPEIPYFEYAHVTFEQVVPSFRAVVDNDNLSGRAKPVLDAMVLLGMFKDDNAKHVEVTYRTRLQQKCEPWLRVLVSTANPPTPLPTCSTSTTAGASSSSRSRPRKSDRASTGEPSLTNLLPKRRSSRTRAGSRARALEKLTSRRSVEDQAEG